MVDWSGMQTKGILTVAGEMASLRANPKADLANLRRGPIDT